MRINCRVINGTRAHARTHRRKQNNNSRIVLSQQLIRDFLKSIKKFYLTNIINPFSDTFQIDTLTFYLSTLFQRDAIIDLIDKAFLLSHSELNKKKLDLIV